MTQPGEDAVILAPLRDEDSDRLFRWINDRELVLLSSPFAPVSRAQHDEWFKDVRTRPDIHIFGIRTTSDDRLVGTCQLLVEERHAAAELRIRIGEAADRGRGYGTSALRALVRYAFDTLGLRRVHLQVFEGNSAALRAYERAGFVREGMLREAAVIDGRSTNVVLMALLAGDTGALGS